MEILCNSEGLNYAEETIRMSKSEKVQMMNRNPILTARHFAYRILSFIHKVILSKHNPIGKVIYYFWRIEFQARGSPHIHSVWWVEGAPNLQTEKGRQALPQFIDSYISANMSDENDLDLRNKVISFQSHHHTSTCEYGHHTNNCRFDFPQPLSDHTKLKPYPACLSDSKCYN